MVASLPCYMLRTCSWNPTPSRVRGPMAAQVRIVASLPCYTRGTVDAQRGAGVFGRSIAGLQALNATGHGRPGCGLELDLVYNPGGPFLAPDQATLEVGPRQLRLALSHAPPHTVNAPQASQVPGAALMCLCALVVFSPELQERGKGEDSRRVKNPHNSVAFSAGMPLCSPIY